MLKSPLYANFPKPADRGPTVQIRLAPRHRAMCLDTGEMRGPGEIATVLESQLAAVPNLGERLDADGGPTESESMEEPAKETPAPEPAEGAATLPEIPGAPMKSVPSRRGRRSARHEE